MPVPAVRTSADSRTRVAAPRAPEPAAAFHFPLIATIAPLVGSLVLFAVTRSPFTLMFAALGPVIAVASFADSRLGSRRTRRREAVRFERELAEAHTAVTVAHHAELALRHELTPGARAILRRSGADPYRWRAVAQEPVLVSLGSGVVASGLEVETVPVLDDGIRARLDALRDAASSLADAPVVVDARLGIGLVGATALTAAVLRAIVVQLAWCLPPSQWLVSSNVADAEMGWLDQLPHAQVHEHARSEPDVTRIDFRSADAAVVVTIASARSRSELPASCRVVVAFVGADAPEIIGHPDRDQRMGFRAEVVSRAQATTWAPILNAEAVREGLVGASASLPALVPITSLLPLAVERPAELRAARGLPAVFAVGASGPVEIDLVEHGPHAIVGGTTGSGKSELLIAWVLALAARHPPDRVSFLLVDFKGGSAFAPLELLPHTVGVMTDLDEVGALRALESLRAELRFRERALAQAGARDIESVPGMPRLVIVVDEFAAMLAEHPDLHSLFSDLAARGRSLGIHLVLCTQRPAGVVRDAVLANADLRISLRVNNRSDSSAVIGTDGAATIPATARGRALLSIASEPPVPVQSAIATVDDARAIATRWSGHPPPRRPWVQPLPSRLELADLAFDEPSPALRAVARATTFAIPFGLLDLPHEQRQAIARWQPQSHGNLLVLGAPGSGKSTLLETLASGAGAQGSGLRALGAHGSGAPTALWLPRAVPAAWDVLADLVGQLQPGGGTEGAGNRILVVDDLDALVARVPGEHRTELLDRLSRVLREGPQHGLSSVLAAQRIAGELQSVVGLVPARLMLRHASRQDWVLAGADGTAFTDAFPPGGGSWTGHRVQVAAGALQRPVDAAPRRAAVDPSKPLAVISARPAALSPRLVAAGYTVVSLAAVPEPSELASSTRVAVIGDVDDWQSRWGSIAALRPFAELVFDGCTPADLRVLTRSRELPPPIERDEVWRLATDGAFERAVLPG